MSATFKIFIRYSPSKSNKDILLRLDEWAYQQWPSIYDEPLAKHGIFSFESENASSLKIRSMLLDLSILLGECYLNLSPNAKWYLDYGLETSDEQRGTCNRIIILEKKNINKEDEWEYYLDMESHVFNHLSLQTKANNLLLVDQKMGYVLSKPVLELLN